MSNEKENNIKKILEEQLKKLLGESLSRLEKRNEEQFEVLKVATTSFENYNNTLTKYVKEAEENEKIREQKEKEQKEKEQKAKEEKEKKERELKEKKEKEKELKEKKEAEKKATKERTLKRNKTEGNLLKGTKKLMESGKKESKSKDDESTPVKKTPSKNTEQKSTASKSTKDKVTKTQASEKSTKTRTSRKDEEPKQRSMVRSKTVKNLSHKPTLEKDNKKSVKGKTATSKKGKKEEEKKVEEKKEEEKKEEEKKEEEKKEEEKKEEEKKEEEKKEEEKKEEEKKEEEKPIIRNPIDYYIKTYNKEKWMLNICNYLPKKDQIAFLSSTKLFKDNLIEKIKEYKKSIDKTLNIQEGETIDKKIEEFKSKVKEEQLNETPPAFALTKGASKAIELLNQEVYQKAFTKTTLQDNLRGILVIYRIMFKLIKNSNISLIENDDEFWLKCCEFITSQTDSKIGSFLQQISSDFNFEENNIYLIQKLLCESQAKINPAVYSKLCPSTGLFTFLVKDALEYCGIINHTRTHPSKIYKHLLYDKEIIERIEKYISFLEKI